MRKIDLVELVSLAALWGASFLFMRLGAAEFGPVALSFVRVLGASVLLLPLLAYKGQLGALRQHWRTIFVVGLTNSALPFMCFNYAALTINAGLSAVFNAASPLFGALIAWLWLKDALTPPRVAGLFIGFAGVLWLVWDQVGFKAGVSGTHATGLAVLACMAATLFYGFSASYTKRTLTGVPPMAVAAGSQLAATLFLVLPAWWWWPAQMPDARAWSYALVLAVACTGLAYLLYFRLIAHVGPANAISVTFLIPVFAVVWGGLFLHEAVGVTMALGCAVILLGTSLATGVLRPRVPGTVRQT